MRADMTVTDAYAPDMCRQTLDRRGAMFGCRESPLGIRGGRSVRREADFNRAGAPTGAAIAGTSVLRGALDLAFSSDLIVSPIRGFDRVRPILPQSRDGFLPPMPHP
ncbi:hypothetical protein AEAC466_15955 [Asticcacaulis sp. AC466]|nr:hypothetical protein AEAC466_15955 [Asticcacaulis sp. AC466]